MFGKLIGNRTIRVLPLAATLAVATLIGLSGSAFAEEEAATDAGVDLARGEKLFALCTQCHASDGGGNFVALAPAIAGMPAWYVEKQLQNFKSGMRGLHAGDTGGLRMYPMSLWLRNEADQKAVAAYVSGLAATDPAHELAEHGDAAKGADYYVVCAGCHGASGEGIQLSSGPPLTGQSDWYLFESIKKYKSAVRGSGVGDPFGALMTVMAGTLPDDNAILDVIAHIQSLEK